MPTETTPVARAQAALARAEAATPGPWVISDGTRNFPMGCTIFAGSQHGRMVAETDVLSGGAKENATFLAAARADVPALAADVTAADRLLAELVNSPDAGIVSAGDKYTYHCQHCTWEYWGNADAMPDPIPHDPECLITQARAWRAGQEG